MPLKCPKCENLSKFRSELRCEQCYYKTGKRQNLKIHVVVVHLETRFPCDLFDYNALHRGDLKGHITAKHLGIKIPCDQCRFKTRSKSYLEIHKNLFT